MAPTTVYNENVIASTPYVFVVYMINNTPCDIPRKAINLPRSIDDGVLIWDSFNGRVK